MTAVGDRNGDEPDGATSAAVQPNIYLYEVGGNIGTLLSAVRFHHVLAFSAGSELYLLCFHDKYEGHPINKLLNDIILSEYNKKLSYCWETMRRESMPRIAEMDVEMTT